MAANPQQRSSDRLIPWYIVLFFVVLTFVFAGFTYIAQKTHTGLVTDQAYEKGLAYNRTIENARAQDALGLISVIEYKNGKVLFNLKDRNGQIVADAKVTAVFFRPVHDGMDMSVDMTARDGIYSALISLPERGLWEVRVHAVTPAGDYQSSRRIVIE